MVRAKLFAVTLPVALVLATATGCAKIQSLIGGEEDDAADEGDEDDDEKDDDDAVAKSEDEDDDDGAGETEVAENDAKPTLDCPEGGEAKGAAPPDGTEQWCERTADDSALPARHGPWTRWHDNGQIAQTTDYRDGKKHGETISWHDNGQKAESGEYEDGETHGTWSQWNEDGQKISQIDYVEGEKTGTAVHWYANGNKREEVEYVANVESGKFIEWHDNGNKLREGKYASGKKDGTWEEWDADGNSLGKETWIAGELQAAECPVGAELQGGKPPEHKEQWCELDGKRVGPYEEWFASGKLQRQGQYLDGDKDGRWAMFYENGQRRNETEWVHGKREGDFHGWHNNGQERIEGGHWNNLRQGMWRYWYRNGQKEAEGEFKRDKKNGQWTTWWKNGEMLSEIDWKAGKKDGQARYWYEDGKPEAAGPYVDGDRHGTWREWDEKTGKMTTVEYRDDEPVDKGSKPRPPRILPKPEADTEPVLMDVWDSGVVVIEVPGDFDVELYDETDETEPWYEFVGPEFMLTVQPPEAGFFTIDEEKGILERSHDDLKIHRSSGAGQTFTIVYSYGGDFEVVVMRPKLEVGCFANGMDDLAAARMAASICESMRAPK